MAEREQKRTSPSERAVEEADVDAAVSQQGEDITERIDDLLDEIDTVLEENAEEFVKNYVQKGGE